MNQLKNKTNSKIDGRTKQVLTLLLIRLTCKEMGYLHITGLMQKETTELRNTCSPLTHMR